MRQKLISLTVILLLGLFSNKVVAQVNVKIDRLPLKEALVEVEKQSGYSFFYSNMLPNQDAVVSVRATGSSIESVMDELLKGLGIKYEVKPDKQITLTEKTLTPKETSSTRPVKVVSGTVVDASGLPVIGAGVLIEGTSTGAVTDENGKYSIEVPSGDSILEFSCMGYQTLKVSLDGRRVIDVTMREDTQFLDEVVVVCR